MFEVTRKDVKMDPIKHISIDTQYYDFAKYQLQRASGRSDFRTFHDYHYNLLNGGKPVLQKPVAIGSVPTPL